MNLSLEWKFCQNWEIDLFDLEELSEGLHLILEADISVFIDISEVLRQDRAILWKVLHKLVSELKALVKLNLELDLGCKNSLSKELFEVLADIVRIYTLDFSIRHLRHHADWVYVAFCSNEGNNMDGDSLCLGVFTYLWVEARISNS